MKTLPTGSSLLGGLAIALAAFSFTPAARANVYATDIQINSTLTNSVSVIQGNSFTLTYHLNDNATAGVTINILSGSSVVSSTSIASPNAGTTYGLNTVSLTAPNTIGNYSVSIVAASTGYSTWQQISPLNANYVAVYPQGIAVDKNTSSPYYGRVVMSCATTATQHSVTQNCGLYKYNADGTPADEGSFGYANYTTNDSGVTSVGEMPSTSNDGDYDEPNTVRIGEDDRIYWCDNSQGGAILACDILATTNQVVICSGPGEGGTLVGPTWDNCPDAPGLNQLGYGWLQFDIINTATTSTYTGSGGIYTGGQAALILGDYGDFPGEGAWMWHMVGTPGTMTADPTDTYGQQVVAPGGSLADRVDGIALDYNLDIFAGEDRNNAGDVAARAAAWTNWNGGVLPPGDQGGAQGGGEFYAETGGAIWTEGNGSSAANDANVFDVVINSKTNPTLMARAHTGANGYGIDLLIPLNPVIKITGVSVSGTTLTINCVSSSPYAPTASQLLLVTTNSLGTGGPITNQVPATFTGGNGVFQTTTTISGSAGFYQVAYPTNDVAGTTPSGSIVTITSSGNVTTALTSIDATADIYKAIAFDNIGNLYGANTVDNYWRVWSPPGANTNTTTGVVTLSVRAGGGS